MDGPPRGIIESFRESFGTGAMPAVYRAPGRVNLIGEHTDYNLGFVCPVALELACYIAAAPNGDGMLRVYSANRGEMREFAIAALPGLRPARDWSDYVAGVAVQLARSGVEVPALNLYIDSRVPQGGGLSSSASLEVSSALALLGEWEMDKVDLARLTRAAEVEFVGLPCGIMDQYISIFGREHAALRIDCRSLDFDVVKLPADVEILAVNTMVKHELGGSAYRHRVAECQAAANAIGVGSLRDASLEQLGRVQDAVARARARHVISENRRVEEFVAASQRGDLWEMGRLFVASHSSLRHDYEVSCEELDFLVDTAISLPYTYGARMTGGGFGGCTVNLLKPGSGPRFEETVRAAYLNRFQIEPVFYPVTPSAGAGRVM